MITCPHCAASIVRFANGGERLKIRTRIFVLHKSGEAEINCPNCKKAIMVGKIDGARLEKAFMRPKFIIPQKNT